MPKEEVQVVSERNAEDSPATPSASENGDLKPEYNLNGNKDFASLKIEPDSDNRLVQRCAGNRESDKKIEKMKEKPIKQGDISPAVLDVGELQTVTLGHVNKIDVLKDENDLDKGVVLNATQLYRPRDVQWVPENLSNDKAKDHELMQNYLVAGNSIDSSADKKDATESPKEEEDISKMSLVRKIVFGFSFLPSIMFVLCFAIILPCEKPPPPGLCSKELWSVTMNDTDLLLNFGLSDESLIISSLAENNTISAVNVYTGKNIWSSILKSTIMQIECGRFDANGDSIPDCLVMIQGGVLYAYNVSNGLPLWNYTFGSNHTSDFVILSDCNEDGVQKIAVFVSPNEIQVISSGSPRLPVNIYGCRNTPTKLTAWFHDKETALIYVCESDSGEGTLQFLKQDSWCAKEKKLKEKGFELLNSAKDNAVIKDVLLFPADNGLVAWTRDLVVFFGNDGKELWSTTVTNHSQNRYMFYGNFLPKEKHVVLISSDPSYPSNSQVTLINAVSGNETSSYSSPFTNTENALLIQGEGKDYILRLLKEQQNVEKNASANKSSMALIPSITEDSTDVFDLPKSIKLRHRLILSQFEMQDNKPALKDNDIHIESISEKEETAKLAAALKGNNLEIFMGRTLKAESGETTSIIQTFQVNNWNKTIDISQCK